MLFCVQVLWWALDKLVTNQADTVLTFVAQKAKEKNLEVKKEEREGVISWEGKLLGHDKDWFCLQFYVTQENAQVSYLHASLSWEYEHNIKSSAAFS